MTEISSSIPLWVRKVAAVLGGLLWLVKCFALAIGAEWLGANSGTDPIGYKIAAVGIFLLAVGVFRRRQWAAIAAGIWTVVEIIVSTSSGMFSVGWVLFLFASAVLPAIAAEMKPKTSTALTYEDEKRFPHEETFDISFDISNETLPQDLARPRSGDLHPDAARSSGDFARSFLAVVGVALLIGMILVVFFSFSELL